MKNINQTNSLVYDTIYLKQECFDDNDVQRLKKNTKLYVVSYIEERDNKPEYFVFATNPLGRKRINEETGLKEFVDYAPILYDKEKQIVGKIFKLGLCKCQCWLDPFKLRRYLNKYDNKKAVILEVYLSMK